MGLLETVMLALIQGITEFLPVSSSAHLILLPKLTGWADQGLAFDVALHLATSLAVCTYLRKDLTSLVRAIFSSASFASATQYRAERSLAWKILFATVPVALAGFFAHDFISSELRSVQVIAYSSILWGVVLFVADGFGARAGLKSKSDARALRWPGAVFIGLAQVISLIPGTSRSGITITAGLFTGLNRSAALKFSFLLSVPVGILAGAYEVSKLMATAVNVDWPMIITGFVISFVSAYIIIHLFLKLVQNFSLKGFVIYRVALGVLLLVFF